MKTWIRDLDAKAFGSGKYSQSYQDELLDIVFANVGTHNPVPFCVEFGFNAKTLTSGSGANVTRMVLENRWDTLLLDGGNENPAIHLYKHFLTPENICEIFRQYGVPETPEYISIDVDSTDLWLFDAVAREYKAMVFSVEYNSNFPLDASITFPKDLNEQWQGDRGYGASLRALNTVANRHGYSLLWVVPYLDAFFLRNDLIDDGSGHICFPFEKWAASTQLAIHGPLKDPARANIFIDYDVYLATNGNLDASRKAARAVCRKYLAESTLQKVVRKASKLTSSVHRVGRGARGDGRFTPPQET